MNGRPYLSTSELRSEDGFIDRLMLDDGSRVAGDLFVDCTGPAASLRATLDDQFDDWSAMATVRPLDPQWTMSRPDASLLDSAGAGKRLAMGFRCSRRDARAAWSTLRRTAAAMTHIRQVGGAGDR